MQKQKVTPVRMNLSTEEEIFERLVPRDHVFRKVNLLINLEPIIKELRKLYSDKGEIGFDVETGLRALLIQFWEDYSDRQMEQAMRENVAIKYFCKLGLTDQTPDHSYFGRLRVRIGASRIHDLFEEINSQLAKKGYSGSVFSVIDASTIITKTKLWEERDKAIADGERKLSNKVVSKYANDKDAKWGAKGKKNIWFGYKRHVSLDCKYGLIEKVCVTPANIPDFKAIKNIAPKNKGVYTDKGYDYSETTIELQRQGCTHLGIRKNNHKDKNKDQDRYRTKIRMPYESTFSQMNKYARYKGIVKVSMQAFMEAIVYNIKKAITYESAMLHV
jgi:IS5 family transposase